MSHAVELQNVKLCVFLNIQPHGCSYLHLRRKLEQWVDSGSKSTTWQLQETRNFGLIFVEQEEAEPGPPCFYSHCSKPKSVVTVSVLQLGLWNTSRYWESGNVTSQTFPHHLDIKISKSGKTFDS